jgi:hypothetical protein
VDLWRARGAPGNPTREDVERLDAATRRGRVRMLRASDGGRLRLRTLLDPWDVVSVREVELPRGAEG